MKYSIRGKLNITDEQPVITLLNTYELWKLEAKQIADKFDNNVSHFHFEVWLNTELEKNELFDDLKIFVDEYGEKIDWHECTHDEPVHKHCNIVEVYPNGGE